VNIRLALPLYRITAAIAFSLLLHSLLLWQMPEITPRTIEATPPPLQAKLEALPKLAKKSIARKPKTPAPILPPAETPGVAPVAITDTAGAEPQAPQTLPTIDTDIHETLPPPLLPKHAQLRFSVHYGQSGLKVGETLHTLESIDGRFSLSAETQTTGMVSIFKDYKLNQTSIGSFTKHGLRPENYAETRTDNKGTRTLNTRFDWDAGKIYFPDGRESTLPEQTQDTLSLPYQLSQLPLNMEILTIALSNGKKISNYNLTVGSDETISTAMGDLRTIKLHKASSTNEEGLVIWLALEYRLLPVKILYLDKSGEVAANMLITDIRVSDE
jgi:Protein of unknown function (DUF3108)